MHCPRCQSVDVQASSHEFASLRCHCQDCHYQFVISSVSEGYSDEIKAFCLKMYRNGLGLNAIAQATAIPSDLLIQWLQGNTSGPEIFEEPTPFRLSENLSEMLPQTLPAGESAAQILAHLPDCVCCFTPDTTLTFANQACCEYFGQSVELLLGQSFLHIIPAAERAVMMQEIAMLLDSGEPFRLECQTVAPDGPLKWHEWIIKILDSSDPTRPVLQATGREITERKVVEETLRHNEAKFRQFAEQSQNVFWIYDPIRQKPLYVSVAYEQIWGRSRENLYTDENALLEAIHPEDRDVLLNALRLSQQGLGLEIEYRILRPDGEIRWIRDRGFILRDAAGQVQRFAGIAEDITDYKLIEQQLRQQLERERLNSEIGQRIYQSLDLDEILNTTVTEIRQLLQTDRVLIYRFEPDRSGYVIVESVGADWVPMLGRKIFDPCLVEEDCIIPYLQGYIGNTADIQTAGLADCYVELLSQFQVRANLVVPVMEGEKLWGLLVAQHCAAPRQWQEGEISFLRQLSTKVSITLQHSQLYQQTQRHAQRQQALNQVIQVIRNSLDLRVAFETAVLEVGALLQVEQADILRYQPEQKVWAYLASYRQDANSVPAYVGLEVPDEGNPLTARLKRGEIIQFNDASTVEDDLNQILAQTFPGSWLMVPLRVSNEVWGSINLVKGPQPFVWQDWQVELICTIADQLAIAIQQSELYQQVQQLNTHLEEEVQDRTRQLQQAFNFEATLKRITDRVRDSLDEQQILQAVVEELAIALGVSSCDVALYNLETQTSTVVYEYRTATSSFHGQTVQMADFPEGYQQLLRGQHFQFCFYPQDTPSETGTARLACSIFDDQGMLGDLWLVKSAAESFTNQEVRLVQQIANQCAIALRQSRLYQKAQTQVEELERLNRLKDDFLSTVSHELRTPLSSIKMAIQMLDIYLKPSGFLESSTNVSHYFQILKDECQREIELVDDLLAFSRFESGSVPLDLVTVDPRVWILQVLELFEEQALNKQQTLEVTISDTITSVTTALSHLERILAELLHNACKYTSPGERIVVSVDRVEQDLILQVSNSGIEIPDAELERIFEKFYRIPIPDRWRYSGTGLGLALVKQLAQQLQGTIAASSGAGWTHFTLTIPLQLTLDSMS